MQLIDLRNEVLAHGFDPTQFGASRINQYINDGYLYVCSSVEYFQDEAVQDFTTISGTALYALPADFEAVRSLRDTNRNQEMMAVSLRKIDRSPARSAAPLYYAMNAANVMLYPTPDASSYPMELRYWKLPTTLVNDTDTPTLPPEYHRMLWLFAVAQAYKAEDDFTMGQQWYNEFKLLLSDFAADVKFFNADAPTQADSMWDDSSSLGTRGWITGFGD